VFLGCSCEKERSGAARKLLIQSATHVSDLMKKATNGSDADLISTSGWARKSAAA
jgi:hypothetical protein